MKKKDETYIKKQERIELVVIVAIISFFFLLSILFVNKLPESDSAFYTLVVEKIVRTGHFPHGIEKIPTDLGEFPIFYPSLFFITNSISEIFNEIYLLKTVLYLIVVSFSYFFMRDVLKLSKLISFITTIFLASNYYLLRVFFLNQKQELFLSAFLVVVCYYLFKDISSKRKVILLSLFCVTLIGIKQTAYPLVVIVALFVLFDKKILKPDKITFFILTILLSLPIISVLFLNTGTILYNDRSPGIVLMVENFLTSNFGIEKIVTDEDFINFASNTDIFLNRESKIYERLPILLFGYELHESIFIILSFLSGIALLKLIFSDKMKIFILLICLAYIGAYFFVSIDYSYFVFVQLLTVPLLALTFEKGIEKIKDKNIKIFLIAFTIVFIFSFVLINSITKLQETKSEIIQNRVASYQLDLEKDGDILSPRLYELALYQDRKVYWFNHYGNWELFETLDNYNSIALNEYMNENEISYIYIPKWRISSTPLKKTWQGNTPKSLVEEFRKDNRLDLYFEDKYIVVFEKK